MYPLRFEPVFRRYIWGGHRLATILAKPIGREACAESWEVVDHGADQSVVAFGPLKGRTLSQLVQQHGRELLGQRMLDRIYDPSLPEYLRGRFPLLLKFLDAKSNLSVQVHPNDEMAAELNPPDLGKTEAWYVMHADPGAKIYAGLKQGVRREQMLDAIEQGTTDQILSSFEPRAGDCILIRAGTVHAIGGGLLIAEIQQASDATFRLFDWNRVDENGMSRPLHIDLGLRAIDFDRGPVLPCKPIDGDGAKADWLVDSGKFAMRRRKLRGPRTWANDRLHIFAITGGTVRFADDPSDQPLGIGSTILVPAACQSTTVIPEGPAEMLDIVLPDC